MPDRAVVASELEQIADHFRRCANVYPDLGFEEREQAVRDALALLKEQEAVEPVKTPETVRDEYNCGKCQTKVGVWLRQAKTWYFRAKFCPECGRKIKWED